MEVEQVTVCCGRVEGHALDHRRLELDVYDPFFLWFLHPIYHPQPTYKIVRINFQGKIYTMPDINGDG